MAEVKREICSERCELEVSSLDDPDTADEERTLVLVFNSRIRILDDDFMMEKSEDRPFWLNKYPERGCHEHHRIWRTRYDSMRQIIGMFLIVRPQVR